MEADSPTMAMSEIYEKKRAALNGYVRHFRLAEMQAGAVFLINGRVVGLDSFGKSETFAKVFRKLVESYALDAIDWFEEGSRRKALKSDVTKFLSGTNAAKVEDRSSVGLGTDLRLESNKVTGFALALEDQILHLSVFAKSNGHRQESYRSSMQGFSNRRRVR